MEKPTLYTRALAVGYHGKSLVDRIHLAAMPGKILSLIGPNGAGKTTILKTLIRQLPPIDGAVFLQNRDMAGSTERQIARSLAAVLTGRPDPELMRCEDVVALGRYPYTGRLGILSPADREKIAEAMELVGVSQLSGHDFDRISDGQRQRVLLARAICQEPRVLVLDEPTSFLDIRYKLEFMHVLRALVREKQIAVILSLHELDLAQRFSDWIVCVRDGAVDRQGTPEEVFSGRYIETLYGVEHGSYLPELGHLEPERAEGLPQVFVVGGGGSGIPVYRALQRMGLPFAAGVLAENDLDLPVAKALGTSVITVPAFEPVDAAAAKQAKALLGGCRHLICTVSRFGAMNQENEALVRFAAERDMLLSANDLSRLEHAP